MIDTSTIFVKKQDMKKLTVADLCKELDNSSAELLSNKQLILMSNMNSWLILFMLLGKLDKRIAEGEYMLY